MSKEVLALALTVFVHVIGMAALVWALLREDDGHDWRGWWRGGGDDGDVPPPDGPRGGGLPLPDAEPSAVRLREPGRLADAHRHAPRRPSHPPERVPQRTPQRS